MEVENKMDIKRNAKRALKRDRKKAEKELEYNQSHGKTIREEEMESNHIGCTQRETGKS